MRPSKLSRIRDAAQQGDWHGALRIASKFYELGEHKEAITRAWSAIQNPQFYRDIGKEPDTLIAEGVTALKARYSL